MVVIGFHYSCSCDPCVRAGTLNNSFGKVIIDQVKKVFALGFDGMWHDDYGEFGGAGGYTFNGFDGPSPHSMLVAPSIRWGIQVDSRH